MKLLWTVRLRLMMLIIMLCASFMMLKAQAETWSDPNYIEFAFNEVALKNEYDAGEHPVRKWREPIRAWIDHRVADQQMHRELIKTQFADLSRYTGHSLTLVDSPQAANMTIIFSNQNNWQQDTMLHIEGSDPLPFSSSVCLGHLWITNTGEIVRAVIAIPVDKARQRGKLITCVVEELTQAMGLPNDSDGVYPSIFNDRSVQSLLSPLDVTLLRLLYSNEVRAGTQASDAMLDVKLWLLKHPNWRSESIQLSQQSGFNQLLSEGFKPSL